MTVKRTFYCDGPECDTSGPDEFPGWLTLTGEGADLHFCNMDCVMKFAAAHSEPPTVIHLTDPEGLTEEQERERQARTECEAWKVSC